MNLKRCPTCRTWVFEDMDTCFACMYRFGSDLAREVAAQKEDFSDESGRMALNSSDAGQQDSHVDANTHCQTVSLAGWNVLVEAMEAPAGAGRLHLVIEPVSCETGPMTSDRRS